MFYVCFPEFCIFFYFAYSAFVLQMIQYDEIRYDMAQHDEVRQASNKL